MSVLWSVLAGIGTVLLFLLKGVGILLLVLGFLMMVDDRFGLLPVAYLLAFIFLLVGFGSLIVAFGMRRADRELRRQEHD